MSWITLAITSAMLRTSRGLADERQPRLLPLTVPPRIRITVIRLDSVSTRYIDGNRFFT
jgi:hypothetical protein